MRVLATGRHGQLVRSLLERNAGAEPFELIALGRPELDLARPETLAAAVRGVAPDVVVNAAAYTAVDQAEDEPELAMRVNGEAPGALAGAARAAGARFVQISTDYVFDGSSTEPYREDAATAPLGVYGRSKLEGERRVREANPDHLILRTAWVYSPFGRNFVKTMLGLAAQRPQLSVVADQRGSPTSALDLADAVLAVLARWRGGGRTGLGGTYHVAGGGEASWAELAAFLFAEAARIGVPAAQVVPISTADWPTRAARPRNSVLDSGRFARDFGWRAPHWRDSVRAVVERLGRAG